MDRRTGSHGSGDVMNAFCLASLPSNRAASIDNATSVVMPLRTLLAATISSTLPLRTVLFFLVWLLVVVAMVIQLKLR